MTSTGEKPVAIERTYGELRGEKDGRLLVFISFSGVEVSQESMQAYTEEN